MSRRTSRCSARRKCKQKEQGLIGTFWAHEIRCTQGECVAGWDRVRGGTEHGGIPEDLDKGKRSARVGCPRTASNQLQRLLDQVEVPQGASRRTALLPKAELRCNRRSPIGNLVCLRMLVVDVLASPFSTVNTIAMPQCQAASSSRRTSKSLLLSNVAPRPT
jgi:hypothetical protein